MKTRVYDLDSNDLGELELEDSVFDVKVNEAILHEVAVAQLAGRRSGTSKAKLRSEVSGGGAKPWKQKGTGRARAGSTRSPLFRGGGVIFAPVPRDYSQNIPKKVKRAALKSALTLKAREGAIKVLDSIGIDHPKTKLAVSAMEKLGISGKKVLLALDAPNDAVEKSFRNIADVKIMNVAGVNVYDLLYSEIFVLTKQSLSNLMGRFDR